MIIRIITLYYTTHMRGVSGGKLLVSINHYNISLVTSHRREYIYYLAYDINYQRVFIAEARHSLK